MRIRMLITPFLLFLILGVLVVFTPTFAAAACCGCGKCWMKYYTNPPCSCPGNSGCPACLTDDSDLLQLNASTDQDAAHTSFIPGALTPTIAKLDVVERGLDLMSGGKCFRDEVALSLLGNARDGLKFVPAHFDEKKTLTFLLEADKEK